jgi:hypothetical protein
MVRRRVWPPLLALALAGGRMHPMHTAVVELTQPTATSATSVQIRVFTDDLRAVVPLSLGAVAGDSAVARYLRGTFQLADRRGRPVALRWEGLERTGDVTRLQLAATVPGGLTGARVAVLMLCERFPDQVNIVRASYAGQATTILFLTGEVAKRLP